MWQVFEEKELSQHEGYGYDVEDLLGDSQERFEESHGRWEGSRCCSCMTIPVFENATGGYLLIYPTFAPAPGHSQLSDQASFVPYTRRWRHCGYTSHRKVGHDHI